MKVAGYLPFTLSDFPGRLAAVVFTQGCNFHCPFCHNGRTLELGGGGVFDPVLEDLCERRRLLDGVVVSGGEPTLQLDLPDVLARLKTLGFQTKLDTNGSFPQVLASLLGDKLVDYVAMDIKAPWERYEQLAGVAVDVVALQRSVELIAKSGVEHQFRTTWVPSLLTEQDRVIMQGQVPSDSLYTFQPFMAELALDPALR